MGWADHYHKQKQAQQLREIERNTAAAAGVEPRKLTWTEKNVMGVKDPKNPRPPLANGHEHVAWLESRVDYLEARVDWLIDVVQHHQELEARRQAASSAPPPPPPPAPPA